MAGWWAETFANIAARAQTVRASMSGEQPSPEGVLAAQLRAALFSGADPAAGAAGTVAATAAAAQAILSGQQAQQGALAAALRPATAMLSGGQSQAGSMAVVARPAVAAMSGSQPVPVLFDAVGGGGSTANSAAALQISHTATGPVLCFVAHANNLNNSNLDVTYGAAQTMTRLGSPIPIAEWSGYKYWLSVFGLLTPESGPKTITITPPGASYLKANTVSYKGVAAFGTPVTQGRRRHQPDPRRRRISNRPHGRPGIPCAVLRRSVHQLQQDCPMEHQHRGLGDRAGDR